MRVTLAEYNTCKYHAMGSFGLTFCQVMQIIIPIQQQIMCDRDTTLMSPKMGNGTIVDFFGLILNPLPPVKPLGTVSCAVHFEYIYALS